MMKTLLVLSVCIAAAVCYYNEFIHDTEECPRGMGMVLPMCFVTPCQLEENCTNYPTAVCRNYYCKDNPCSTVWRYNGEIVDCGNYDYY